MWESTADGAEAQQGGLLEMTQRREARRSCHTSKVWSSETRSYQGGEL